MAQFNVTELDFAAIKASIKDHFRSQSKYNDWDFDGSGLNLLLDILAYNTHYNAMVAHFSMNEAFLDSAQIRGNVVSHAKMLGYTPRSTIAARATINVVSTAGTNPPEYSTLARGTRFRTTLNGNPYNFVVLDAQQVSRNTSTNKYTYPNVTICHGTLKRMLYRVDNSLVNQKFEIPDEHVDTTTMRVRIKPNTETDEYQVYTRYSTLSGVDSSSTIYYLQENSSGKYEIYFGDGVLGNKPSSNNIVEIEYVFTNGENVNGAGIFESVDALPNSVSSTVTTVSSSSGGIDRESIESIRYNAPFTFVSQNRAVTADDYRAIIEKEVGFIDAISVWGGEIDPVPDFGKVFISIKPQGAQTLTQAQKNNIISNVLRNKNVVSITPVLVDPEYTNISLDVFFKYNPNLTDKSRIELQAEVLNTISNYNNTNLKRFDGVFRYSQLLNQIDSTDRSILNSDARVFMYKTISAVTTTENYNTLQFSSPIYTTSSTESVLDSTQFTIDGISHYFADEPISGSVNRQIYMFKTVGNSIVRVKNIGTIYPSEGKVVLGGFTPDINTSIRITVMPNSNDLAPKRNQLLEIDLLGVAVVGEIDTIALAGSAGTVNYVTPPRHRT